MKYPTNVRIATIPFMEWRKYLVFLIPKVIGRVLTPFIRSTSISFMSYIIVFIASFRTVRKYRIAKAIRLVLRFLIMEIKLDFEINTGQ